MLCPRFKDEIKNLLSQMEKQEATRGALQKLISALKQQIELTREEGDLKLKEETQKRIDCSKQFQVKNEYSGKLMSYKTITERGRKS